MAHGWSEARRLLASERAKRRWKNTDPAVREEWMELGRIVYASKYPERAQLSAETRARIESGVIVPEPCDGCGGAGEPLYDWTELVLAGWRCYPCR